MDLLPGSYPPTYLPKDTLTIEAGRLYRSGTRFSSEQLHHQHLMSLDHDDEHGSYDCDRLVTGQSAGGTFTVSSPVTGASASHQTEGNDSAADDPHRTSFVKFAEGDSDGEEDGKETPFVRHNTPHPKDLKAKAQKHFKGIT